MKVTPATPASRKDCLISAAADCQRARSDHEADQARAMRVDEAQDRQRRRHRCQQLPGRVDSAHRDRSGQESSEPARRSGPRAVPRPLAPGARSRPRAQPRQAPPEPAPPDRRRAPRSGTIRPVQAGDPANRGHRARNRDLQTNGSQRRRCHPRPCPAASTGTAHATPGRAGDSRRAPTDSAEARTVRRSGPRSPLGAALALGDELPTRQRPRPSPATSLPASGPSRNRGDRLRMNQRMEQGDVGFGAVCSPRSPEPRRLGLRALKHGCGIPLEGGRGLLQGAMGCVCAGCVAYVAGADALCQRWSFSSSASSSSSSASVNFSISNSWLISSTNFAHSPANSRTRRRGRRSMPRGCGSRRRRRGARHGSRSPRHRRRGSRCAVARRRPRRCRRRGRPRPTAGDAERPSAQLAPHGHASPGLVGRQAVEQHDPAGHDGER